jgi:hypothetical protein
MLEHRNKTNAPATEMPCTIAICGIPKAEIWAYDIYLSTSVVNESQVDQEKRTIL